MSRRQHKRHSPSKLYPEGLPLLQSSCLAINKSASHALFRTCVSYDVMHNAETSCWSHAGSGMPSTMLKLALIFQPPEAKPKAERLRLKIEAKVDLWYISWEFFFFPCVWVYVCAPSAWELWGWRYSFRHHMGVRKSPRSFARVIKSLNLWVSYLAPHRSYLPWFLLLLVLEAFVSFISFSMSFLILLLKVCVSLIFKCVFLS